MSHSSDTPDRVVSYPQAVHKLSTTTAGTYPVAIGVTQCAGAIGYGVRGVRRLLNTVTVSG
jgi:hypothetical protein